MVYHGVHPCALVVQRGVKKRQEDGGGHVTLHRTTWIASVGVGGKNKNEKTTSNNSRAGSAARAHFFPDSSTTAGGPLLCFALQPFPLCGQLYAVAPTLILFHCIVY